MPAIPLAVHSRRSLIIASQAGFCVLTLAFPASCVRGESGFRRGHTQRASELVSALQVEGCHGDEVWRCGGCVCGVTGQTR